MSLSPTHPLLLVGVAAGGVVGSLGRYAVGLALPHSGGSTFPWGTLTVNLTGALAMGILVGWLATRTVPAWVHPVVGAGLLGGWTTFSAFAVEVHDLVTAGAMGGAAAYLIVSLVGAVLAVGAGHALGERTTT